MKRRILSLILVLMLLAGILPAPTMAAGSGNAVTMSFSIFQKKLEQLLENSNSWKENVMRKDTASKTGGKVLGSKIQRSKIKTVTFLGSLSSAAEDSWDVSEAKDGSVKAWVTKNGSLYDLYIGASGGVCAPENCSGLFCGYTKLEKIDFGYNFHTDNATTMSYMFSHCNELEELDLTRFKTANVKRMECMFMHCYDLEELDLTSFDVGNVIDMGSMFWQCSSLMELNMPDMPEKKNRNTAYMFNKCDPDMVVTYGKPSSKDSGNDTPTETTKATQPPETTAPARDVVKTYYADVGDTIKVKGPSIESVGYRTWEWSITEGSKLATLSDANLQTCTIKAKKAGEVLLTVKCSYQTNGYDVLTGNSRRIRHAETRQYLVVIE